MRHSFEHVWRRMCLNFVLQVVSESSRSLVCVRLCVCVCARHYSCACTCLLLFALDELLAYWWKKLIKKNKCLDLTGCHSSTL